MQIAVASGKGGTGKTLLTSCLARVLSDSKPRIVDADVEEPDLGLVLPHLLKNSEPVYRKIPLIDKDRCNYCGICAEVCVFNALLVMPEKVMVFPELCHSCGACSYLCPEKAISETDHLIGDMELSHIRTGGTLVTGRLRIGEPLSPPLIKAAKETGKIAKYNIIDCPPGTTCPMIESIRDADYCLLVTEPTPFGAHDLDLSISACKILDIPTGIVINRWRGDDSPIDKIARDNDVPVIARIPFNEKLAAIYSRGENPLPQIPELQESIESIIKHIKEKKHMKELLTMSGKGGTGKTSVASSFIALADSCIICDYDVDASNLPILLKPECLSNTPFSGGLTAQIDLDTCISCGLCQSLCRFDAISDDYIVDELSCEGCAFCSRICPVEAINMSPHSSGQWYEGITTDKKPIFYAELKPGEENSGKLVAEVKTRAHAKAKEENFDLVISDGPPGIGCSAISSLVGVDLALIVAEPSVSAFSDIQRAFELLRQRGIKAALLINKFDLNHELSVDIEEWANQNGIHFAGKIPFDLAVADAVAAAVIPAEIPEVKDLMLPIWEKIQSCLNGTLERR